MIHWFLSFDAWTLFGDICLNVFLHVGPVKSIPGQIDDPLSPYMAHVIVEMFQSKDSVSLRQYQLLPL